MQSFEVCVDVIASRCAVDAAGAMDSRALARIAPVRVQPRRRACPQLLGKPRRDTPRKRASSTKCAGFPQRHTALLEYLIFFDVRRTQRMGLRSMDDLGQVESAARSVRFSATCPVFPFSALSPFSPFWAFWAFWAFSDQIQKKSGSSGRAVGAVESPRRARWNLPFRGTQRRGFPRGCGQARRRGCTRAGVIRASARLSKAPAASIRPGPGSVHPSEPVCSPRSEF